MTKPKAKRERRHPTTDTAYPFLDHVGEVRRRVLYSVAAIGIAATLSYHFRDPILAFLLRPLGQQQLYYATPLGAMSFTFELCLLVGIMLASPIWLYHLWRFLRPAVTEQWQTNFRLWVTTSSLLAVLGAAYGYGISLPATLSVSRYFQSESLTPLLSASEYLTFVTRYILAFALFFQLPLFVIFASLAGLVTTRNLVGYQRQSLVASCVVGAVLTPTPDFINQLMLALPLFLLYEVSVVCMVVKARIDARNPASMG